MLLYSFKFPRKIRRSVGFLLALAIVLVAGRAVTTAIPVDGMSSQKLPSVKVKNLEAQQDFLRELGWEAKLIDAETSEVIIPEDFDEIYQKYNAIQQQHDLDLLKYRGKKAMKYVYLVANHPSGATNVRVNLLVYKNKVVGGDVCALGLEGFMHSLYYPNPALSTT